MEEQEGNKVNWKMLYGVTAFIDSTQILLGLTGVGVIINGILDPLVGISLIIYLEYNGVSVITHPGRLISMLGIAGVEELTGGVAPAWIMDIWYIKHTTKGDGGALSNTAKPGVRLPRKIRNPVNSTPGIRMPNKKSDSEEISLTE